jgi:hypothetical protein
MAKVQRYTVNSERLRSERHNDIQSVADSPLGKLLGSHGFILADCFETCIISKAECPAVVAVGVWQCGSGS